MTVDDNKELVMRVADNIRAVFCKREGSAIDNYTVEQFMDEAQAALSIIQPELQKRDEVLDKILHRISQWQEDNSILGDIFDDIHRMRVTTLKTTTGHDNNTEKRGKR